MRRSREMKTSHQISRPTSTSPLHVCPSFPCRWVCSSTDHLPSPRLLLQRGFIFISTSSPTSEPETRFHQAGLNSNLTTGCKGWLHHSALKNEHFFFYPSFVLSYSNKAIKGFYHLPPQVGTEGREHTVWQLLLKIKISSEENWGKKQRGNVLETNRVPGSPACFMKYLSQARKHVQKMMLIIRQGSNSVSPEFFRPSSTETGTFPSPGRKKAPVGFASLDYSVFFFQSISGSSSTSLALAQPNPAADLNAQRILTSNSSVSAGLDKH